MLCAFANDDICSVDVEGANWGYRTAWLFFCTGTVTVVFVWLFVPEPSARNSAELDEMYERGVPAWKMRKFETHVQRQQCDQALYDKKEEATTTVHP